MSSSDEYSPPADTMRERADESRLKLWLLITADRWLVTACIVVGAYLLLLALAAVGPASFRKLATSSAVSSVFSTLVIATVTSVTLVLTISQVVLSQEIGSLGEQRERMNDAVEFREEVASVGGADVAPAEPSQFLRALIDTVEDSAETLRDAVAASGDPALDDVEVFASSVVDHSRVVRDDLADAEFGTFETLLPVLNYNYAWKIVAARRFRHAHDDALPERAADALDELARSLRFFGPAREYFKTLYFQWEVVNVSRIMLYGAMPALMLAGYASFVVDPSTIDGTVGGFTTAYLFVSAAYVAALVPFAALLAYLLRLLTIAKRTLAIGPFILRESEHLDGVPSARDRE